MLTVAWRDMAAVQGAGRGCGDTELWCWSHGEEKDAGSSPAWHWLR